jgi:hypothetical protein
MSEEDHAAAVDHVSRSPEDGDELGGGLFKIRVARPGRGKSKGWRILVGYRRRADTVYLLTVFAKGDKANLTKQELQVLKDLMKKEFEIGKDEEGDRKGWGPPFYRGAYGRRHQTGWRARARRARSGSGCPQAGRRQSDPCEGRHVAE